MRRLAVILLLGLVLAAAWVAYALYVPYQGFPQEGVFVDVPRGASGRAIARLLAERGVVKSRLAFEALCRWRAGRTLQAGEYFFNRPVTAFEVFDAIAAGRVYEISVTVPEGFTMFAIAELLERQGLTDRHAFLDAARDPSPIRDLAPRVPSLEGFLFPATYHFPRHRTPRELAAAMVGRFRDAWQALPGADASRAAASVDAVVTLASLVERETSVPAERPVIAGVFTNRLRLGLALQCDPTVIYALELAGNYNGSLASRDLSFESPYNTYRHPGLPPGPIASPGEASLRAALAPPQVEYLYFVADGHGGHVFGKTLEEHNRNVARYRRQIVENAREQHGSESGEAPAKKTAKRFRCRTRRSPPR